VSKRIAVSILVLFSLAACGDEGPTGGEPRFSAEESFSFDVGSDARTLFRITGINGTITITGVANPYYVSVSGVRRVVSDTQEDADRWLDSLAVVVDSTAEEVTVETVQPTVTGRRDFVVDYTISLPQSFDVNLISANGDVACRSISGDILANSANGDVTFEATSGNLSLSLANGEVHASGSLAPGGQIVLIVANGSIDLTIPRTTSAVVSALVTNGDITVQNLDMSISKRTRQVLEGILGGGDGSISLQVGNGTIELSGF
jgi:DUF4097 and DUF4098 domain-containing protein YvlB